MSKTYSNKGFVVTVEDDGSIKVKAGDSLSAYSMAIEGNFHALYDYSRRKNGTLEPIINVDLIYAGETIWHEPSIPLKTQPVKDPRPEPALPKKPDGTYDVQRILEKYKLPPNYYEPINTLLLNRARGAQVVVSFIGLYATLPAAVGFGNAALGPILGTVAAVYGMWKARNYALMQIGFRAVSYGIVAWAHDQGKMPGLPSAIERSYVQSGRSEEIERARKVWEEAVSKGVQKLRTHIQQHKLNEDHIKAIFRAFGEGNMQKGDELAMAWLAANLLLDAADSHCPRNLDKRNFLQPWSYYPNDRYVGRPNYPPKINKRYPF